MTKTNWGEKRTCPSCAARFYDLGKNPATCPKCGKSHDVTVPVKSRRGKAKTITVAADEPLAKLKAKSDQAQKAAKPVKKIEGVDLEEFEGIETLDSEEEIEELEEIEDIDSIEELEEVEDAGKESVLEDESTIEDEVANDALVDDLDEEEEVESEEEEDEKPQAKKSKQVKPIKDKKKK